MIGVNDHILAVLPTLLFAIMFSTRYIVHRNNLTYFFEETVKFQIEENYLLTISIEVLALSIINGIIIITVSFNVFAGVPFLIIGFSLPAAAISMLSTHKTKEAGILLVSTAFLFFFELIYFLDFGIRYRVFGGYIGDWAITALIFFAIVIGGGLLALILIARFFPDLIETDSTNA